MFTNSAGAGNNQDVHLAQFIHQLAAKMISMCPAAKFGLAAVMTPCAKLQR